MKKNKHGFKSFLIAFLSLCTILLIILIFAKLVDYKKSSYKLDVKFLDNSIVKLTNDLPISDEIGKNYTGKGIESGIAEYKNFTISNNNDGKVEYEIYLTKSNGKTKNIRSNYIKVYLTDKNNNPLKGFDTKGIKSYYDLSSLDNKIGSKLLYRGYLNSGESDDFILRSWVADTYILSSEEEVFNYSIDVRIK